MRLVTWYLFVSFQACSLCSHSHWNCIRDVVVLDQLGLLAFEQQQYDESLQMFGRLCDILMKTSPDSERLAAGRQ